jgi:O-antigen ligase
MSRVISRSEVAKNVLLRDSNWIALAAPILIFAGQLASGALMPFAALALALSGALLVLAALSDRRLRDDFGRSRAPLWPAAPFCIVLVVVLLSLTPYVPDGPHPAWRFTGQAPAAGTMDKALTTLELFKLCGLGCFFLLGSIAGVQDQRADLAIKATLGCGAAMALWSFGAQITGAHGAELRLQGPYSNPNATATVMGILLVLALALTFRAARAPDAVQSTSRSLPVAAAALIFIVCLMMAASRGGAISAAAGIAAFVALYIFGRGQVVKRGGWVLIGTLAVLGIVIAVVGDRLFGRIEAQSLADTVRETTFRTHWEAFQAAPWTGSGLGAFDIVNRTLLNSANVGDLWFTRAAHNVYLSWLELGGLLAAVPMFLCLGAIMFQTLRGVGRRSRMTTLLCGLIGADVVVLAHGTTDFALEIYSIPALWSFLLGIQYTLAQGARR